jgi:hypothetical protein
LEVDSSEEPGCLGCGWSMGSILRSRKRVATYFFMNISIKIGFVPSKFLITLRGIKLMLQILKFMLFDGILLGMKNFMMLVKYN